MLSYNASRRKLIEMSFGLRLSAGVSKAKFIFEMIG